jgi:hypothetical protein
MLTGPKEEEEAFTGFRVSLPSQQEHCSPTLSQMKTFYTLESYVYDPL